MINVDKYSIELRNAISRLLQLSGDECYQILDHVPFRDISEAPYTIPNALAILKFLGTPVEEEELRESKLLYQGSIPEPHCSVFHKLATRQRITIDDINNLNSSVARDEFLKTLNI